MGQLLRSEEMKLVQLFMQLEAAHDTVDELGEIGLIQFRDVCIFGPDSQRGGFLITFSLLLRTQLNPDVNLFQRNFVNEVKRADEMERKIKFFEDEIAKQNFEEEVQDHRLEVGSSSRSEQLPMDDLEVMIC